jgi:hypothetical protein
MRRMLELLLLRWCGVVLRRALGLVFAGALAAGAAAGMLALRYGMALLRRLRMLLLLRAVLLLRLVVLLLVLFLMIALMLLIVLLLVLGGGPGERREAERSGKQEAGRDGHRFLN